MDHSEKMSLGIVLERRDVESQWTNCSWQAVSVIPGAAEIDDWIEVGRGEDWVQYHAGTLELELFRKETEGYKHNLSLEQPSVFVVLREGDDGDPHEVVPFLATVCPYEAQDYMDSSEEIVDLVPLPDSIAAWLAEYIEHHHVDEPFKKRKNKTFDPGKEGFNKKPRVSNKWNTVSNG